MTPARHRHLATIRVCSDMAPTDHSVVYFVICQFKDGRASAERDTARMTRELTLQDIRSGELSDVVMIIETEFTPDGLSSRDVTESMLAEVEHIRHPNNEAIMTAFDRLIGQLDHDKDIRKHWSA